MLHGLKSEYSLVEAPGTLNVLSQGGVQVEAGQLKAGDNIRISFRLPSSGIMVDAHGTVVWAKEARQGIRFGKLSSAAREAIQQFISQVETP